MQAYSIPFLTAYLPNFRPIVSEKAKSVYTDTQRGAIPNPRVGSERKGYSLKENRNIVITRSQ
ncbi:hypothetical protein P154DRAFT_517978 [Amniculicola lignicola CBS 123094]|uniref:Uncharacterized protein n=1 Tax=Amniculicola lignicola CBS 123094 TaxID=1392246 RepID=A0A6A5X100_9PLEO|nr:hypothetical protein P154DRAFT_517978 [Amniculicola lignicola CBS 123094]